MFRKFVICLNCEDNLYDQRIKSNPLKLSENVYLINIHSISWWATILIYIQVSESETVVWNWEPSINRNATPKQPWNEELKVKQGSHDMSGKCQEKTFSPGQGKVREFRKNVREFWSFDPFLGIVREFCDLMSGNCQGILWWHYFLDWNFHHMISSPYLCGVYITVCLANINSRSTDYYC